MTTPIPQIETETQPQFQTQPKPLTIGVFDSGFGGLTVLRALLPLIPSAHYIYLGDTARLPYGSKSRETIARYAVSSARFLHEQGAQLLVIACNTATALALEDIQQALPIPVIGVVQPGAQAALAATAPLLSPPSPSSKTLDDIASINANPASGENPTFRENPASGENSAPGENPAVASRYPKASALGLSSQPQIGALALGICLPSPAEEIAEEIPVESLGPHVLVLATAATVQSHAYTHALNALGLEATEKACPLLVPLVEEGWTNHPVTDEVLRIYLTEALSAAPATRTLLLGCTHYPLIQPAIHRVLTTIDHPLTIIDSAEATAQATAALVSTHFSNHPATHTKTTFYATDSIEKFQRLGSAFLGQPVSEVTLVDLGG